MAKQIVVCMDGTWNDPIEQTNVYRLFEMLPGEEQQVEEDGPIRSHLVKSAEQLAAFYLESIGNGGRTQGLLGGTQDDVLRPAKKSQVPSPHRVAFRLRGRPARLSAGPFPPGARL